MISPEVPVTPVHTAQCCTGRRPPTLGRASSSRGGFSTKQRVKSTPSLPTHNQFSVLSVDSMTEIEELKTKDVPNIEKPAAKTFGRSSRLFRPCWERSLPPNLVIDMLEERQKACPLKLKVELETTDTGEIKLVSALVDSGATGMFID